jgi:hypothetical protein
MGNGFITAIAWMYRVDQEMEKEGEGGEDNRFSSAYKRLAYIRYLSPQSLPLSPSLFSPSFASLSCQLMKDYMK